MFRTILVPLDGSRFAEAALPVATSFAASARGRLHLLLAHQPVAAMVGMGDVVMASAGLGEELPGGPGASARWAGPRSGSRSSWGRRAPWSSRRRSGWDPI